MICLLQEYEIQTAKILDNWGPFYTKDFGPKISVYQIPGAMNYYEEEDRFFFKFFYFWESFKVENKLWRELDRVGNTVCTAMSWSHDKSWSIFWT